MEQKIIESPEKNCLKYETIYEKIIKSNKDIKFTKVFPDFSNKNENSFDKICNEIKKTCANQQKNLISAYWTQPDTAIHNSGINSYEVKQELKTINDSLKKLANELKDTIFIITADHGAVDVEEVYLNEYKDIDDCLEKPPSIESRFVLFFLKKNKKDLFKKLINEYFKDKFLLYDKNEFLNRGFLGRGIKHSRIDSYLGDVILIGKSDLSIRYTINGVKFKTLKADHSGITKEEMQVPVIVIKNKKI